MIPSLIGLAVLVAIAIAIGVFFWWSIRNRESEEDEPDQPMLSIVALLREPQRLEPIYLVKAAEKAWGADLGSGLGGEDDQGEDGFVVGTEGLPTIVISYQGQMMMVNNFSSPYFDDPEAVAAKLPDLRLQELVGQHRAWLSVDAMGIDDFTDADELRQWHRLLGRLITELIDDNCLALAFTLDGQIFPNMDETLEMLKSDDPLEALQIDAPVPVVPVAADDPRMQAAVAEARSKFPEFVEALENGDGDHFSVKAPISGGGNTEYIWLTVTAYENGIIYGTLANEPIDLGSLKIGSRVKTKVEELNDWAFYRDEDLVGGFTIKVVMEAARENQAEADKNEDDEN